MKRTRISPDLTALPERFHPLLRAGRVYDSSCSNLAQVLFLDVEEGYYLKRAPKGSLAREVEMTRFYGTKTLFGKPLAATVLDYFTDDTHDWLLTSRVPGEDCTHADYLADPKRLSETTATLLRALHELPTEGCPVPDHTALYLAAAEENYRTGSYDKSAFPDSFGYASADEAIAVLRAHASALRSDTLLHGDYCLPNIMLDSWRFGGLIDLDHGGVGDRHVDLFWGVWTLGFNLKTDAYTDRFLDAYGRDLVDTELLRTVAAAEVFG